MTDVNAPATGGQGSTSTTVSTPVTPPADPTGTQVTTPPAATAPETPSWLAGADELTVGYVQNKGWKEPAQVLDGYRNLEKLLGADKANNAVIIPKEGADPKEWAAVYDRLGRPTGSDGYKVELPAGGDKTIHDASMAKFHELGLTKQQGETLANWYNGVIQQSMQAESERSAETFRQEDAAVRQEWGQAYTQNLAQAQAAARGLGLDAATIDKMSGAIGHKATMSLLQKVGTGMKEDSLARGNDDTGFGSALTPGQAKAEIKALMDDKAFVAKYTTGDAESKAKMARLHQFAYPEEK